tara:strand:- start:406 stop:1014 length:609 start_codon:yes stop_codon:yes gene_type:complete
MIVLDNFFDEPYRVRGDALKYTYNPSPDGKWPGFRSRTPEFLGSQVVTGIGDFLHKDLVICNSFLQWSDESWITGAAHSDVTDYTSLIFLSLDEPPNTGIEIYPKASDDRKIYETQTSIEWDKWLGELGDFYQSDRDWVKRFLFNKKLESHDSKFKNPCVVSNRFNRCVVFDSKCYHRAQNFFGTTISNSRLTLISFLNLNT